MLNVKWGLDGVAHECTHQALKKQKFLSLSVDAISQLIEVAYVVCVLLSIFRALAGYVMHSVFCTWAGTALHFSDITGYVMHSVFCTWAEWNWHPWQLSLLNKKTACDDNSEFTLFCLAWWQENSTRMPDPATSRQASSKDGYMAPARLALTEPSPPWSDKTAPQLLNTNAVETTVYKQIHGSRMHLKTLFGEWTASSPGTSNINIRYLPLNLNTYYRLKTTRHTLAKLTFHKTIGDTFVCVCERQLTYLTHFLAISVYMCENSL
jgi:hypothetical protein